MHYLKNANFARKIVYTHALITKQKFVKFVKFVTMYAKQKAKCFTAA